MEAALKKLQRKYGKDRRYSALYFPGQYWLASMSFVYDYGGQIAELKGGKWKGTLDSPQAIRGLNAFKSTFLSLSKASKSTDEANPFPTVPFSQGHAASFVGPGWQFGYALDPKAGNPKLKPYMGAFAMPSHTKGKTMPAFLGGSDLAIPAASSNVDLAVDWIAAFTATVGLAAVVFIFRFRSFKEVISAGRASRDAEREQQRAAERGDGAGEPVGEDEAATAVRRVPRARA